MEPFFSLVIFTTKPAPGDRRFRSFKYETEKNALAAVPRRVREREEWAIFKFGNNRAGAAAVVREGRGPAT